MARRREHARGPAWFQTPVIIHYHGSVPEMVSRLGRSGRLALMMLWRVAKGHVAITRASADLLNKTYAQRVP